MCGIVGIVDLRDKAPVDKRVLERMNASHTHRGPDGDGVFIEPGAGLGHRRLAIIDLAGGQQPLFNEDGSVVVVYNGEIYNFRELADELTAAGHAFRTRCDTEVIVHAWEEWGSACVERFRGMFAFGLWDRNRQTLFLARDRIGIKPLYYALLPNGHLVFGSELKSLLAHPDVPRRIDPHAVEDFLAFGYVPDPRTIFRGVAKLPPGHTLEVRRGGSAPVPRRFWDVPFRPVSVSEGEVTEELLGRLREAVELRLIADVPLGAFLSGGVDSSAVVALMAGLSSEPVNTCSISFGEAAFDEAGYARQVAERYHTNHHVRRADPGELGLIEGLARVYDEPFADSSAMPTMRVCALARERVKVALSGDGGDENFAGYRRYRWHLIEEGMRRRLPAALRTPLFGLLGRLYPKADWAPKVLRAKSTFQSLARDSAAGYFHGVSFIPDPLRQQLYSPSFRRELGGYHALEVFRGHLADCPTDDPLGRIQYLDFKTYLPGDILTKVDRASMAHGLEVRVPILDHAFVEWASGLPSGMKLHGGEGKHVFKRALKPLLSDDILYRDKMGFSVPLDAWFRGPLREAAREVVTGPRLRDTGIFDGRMLERLYADHQAGRRHHGSVLWSLWMLDAFLRDVADSTGDAA
jgi:asparagine synthase (glutamine-hydrolysing)